MMYAPDHWLVVPVVLPLVMAALLLVVERLRPAWQAPLSLVATLALAVLSLRLVAYSRIVFGSAITVSLCYRAARPIGTPGKGRPALTYSRLMA